MPAGFLALLSFVIFIILVPLIYMEAMLLAFYKLGLSPIMGIFIVLSIFAGSFFDIPIKRYQVSKTIVDRPPLVFRRNSHFPTRFNETSEMVIAANLGGCIIPLLIVVYELIRLVLLGVYLEPLIAIGINMLACFFLSRPVAGVGIAMNPFVPGIIAALCGLLLYPENSPAIAFCSGVLGPIFGADLFKLKNFMHSGGSLVSIGGAGSFDGVVISGIVALLLS